MKFPCHVAVPSVLLALGLAIFLSGCAGLRGDGTDGQEPDRVDLTDRRVFLGNVTLVNDRSKFVLIKTPVNRRLKAGIALESFRDGEMTSELLFSPEQSFGLMTADIRTGAPMVGDAVFLAYSEGFEPEVSDRMKFEMEQQERLNQMNFWERRKYERDQKRKRKAKKRRE